MTSGGAYCGCLHPPPLSGNPVSAPGPPPPFKNPASAPDMGLYTYQYMDHRRVLYKCIHK